MSRATEAGDGHFIEMVVDLIRTTQRLSPDEPLGPETVLLDRGLALDSVALLDLVLALEDHFSIRIADGDVTPAHFETIDRVARLIDRIQHEASIC